MICPLLGVVARGSEVFQTAGATEGERRTHAALLLFVSLMFPSQSYAASFLGP